MKNWTIGRRLIISFLSVATLTAMLGMVGYYSATRSDKAINEIGGTRLPGVEKLLVMARCAEQIKTAQRTMMDADLNLDDRKRQFDRVRDARETYEPAWKAYDSLPKLPQEAACWQELKAAWAQWRKDNDVFFKMGEELDDLDILNPPALQRDIQQFTGDHYKLNLKVVNHVELGEECKGGDDPTACNFGRWLAKNEISNPDLKQIINEMRPHHDAFHAAVKSAKELTAAGNKDRAIKVAREDMRKTADSVFEGFAKLQHNANKAAELRIQMHDQLMTTCRNSQLKVADLVNKLVKISTESADATVKASSTQATSLKLINLATTVFGVIGALMLGLLISRGINRSLQRIATGLNDGAVHVASAASQVTSASQSLAEGSSEQAASIEETSASLEEMSSMTKRNADNSQQANELARQTRTAADKGVADMQAMSAAMAEIQSSSDDIAKIIKTIDEIAFQTNILALNAAVEAARAGDAGMGFAVVADEVRNLAQRSAQAAKETAAKIECAIAKTTQGVQLSAKVSETLNEIVGKARRMDELAAEVAGASNEQSQGVSQVNQAVGQMDKVTQSNAASAEECAASAEELNSQAHAMKGAVTDLMKLVGNAATAENSLTPPSLASVSKPKIHPSTNGHGNSLATKNGKGFAQDSVSRHRSVIPMADDLAGF
ncbi:MAG TPA: methyl-accepting chemotaxis protein [Candidatus Paceibacterota bacterium]|nr:methyl-accepting chemotaxis protein [Candidatus Paceibacterota bacterium]